MLSPIQPSPGAQAVQAIEVVLDRTFLFHTPLEWVTFAAAWLALCILFSILRRLFAQRLNRVAQRTVTRVDDLIVKVIEDQRIFLYVIIFLYVASFLLPVPGSVSADSDLQRRLGILKNLLSALKYAAIVAMAIQLFLSSRLMVDFGLELLISRTKTPEGKPDPSIRGSLVVLRFVVMLLIAIGVCLLALENFGVNIGTMITGLGIGGIAIALAIQKVLGDLLASVSILMDKPFVVGDYVQIGDKSGTVEVIGLKTTRMRAPTGEQLIFGNSDILNSRIHNYQRLEERRVTLSLSLVTSLSAEKLRDIPRIVKSVVDQERLVRFDRCHLKLIGERAFVFEVSYLVLSSDYLVYMDSQQKVYLDIIDAFAREQIRLYFIP